MTAVHASATASLTSSISSIEKLQTIGDGRGGEPRERNPFGASRDAQLDEVGARLLDGLIHTSAFIAASSLSKMPKILTRPVMSKIFLICGLRADEIDRAAVLAHALEAADQHAQAGRIDVAHFLEVDDQMIDAAIDQTYRSASFTFGDV